MTRSKTWIMLGADVDANPHLNTTPVDVDNDKVRELLSKPPLSNDEIQTLIGLLIGHLRQARGNARHGHLYNARTSLSIARSQAARLIDWIDFWNISERDNYEDHT